MEEMVEGNVDYEDKKNSDSLLICRGQHYMIQESTHDGICSTIWQFLVCNVIMLIWFDSCKPKTWQTYSCTSWSDIMRRLFLVSSVNVQQFDFFFLCITV